MKSDDHMVREDRKVLYMAPETHRALTEKRTREDEDRLYEVRLDTAIPEGAVYISEDNQPPVLPEEN